MYSSLHSLSLDLHIKQQFESMYKHAQRGIENLWLEWLHKTKLYTYELVPMLTHPVKSYTEYKLLNRRHWLYGIDLCRSGQVRSGHATTPCNITIHEGLGSVCQHFSLVLKWVILYTHAHTYIHFTEINKWMYNWNTSSPALIQQQLVPAWVWFLDFFASQTKSVAKLGRNFVYWFQV